MQLTDVDIMKWNDSRLPQKLMVYAKYTNTLDINIEFNLNELEYNPSGNFKPCGDPKIDFRFTFSIAKDRSDFFFEILNKLKSKKFDNKVRKDNGTYEKLTIKEEDIKKIEETEHRVLNTDYIRYTYNFSTYTSSIMAWVYLLESTIEFFSKIWGYDKDGGEHNLLKYPIGSIVCKGKDKSIDYLILDLDYEIRGGSYDIKYVIAQMISTGSIIKYGDIQKEIESNLSWSRNGRIDDILN
jgi:hypothetical protein